MRRAVLGTLLPALLMLAMPASVAAFPLTGGCGLTLTSVDASGAPIGGAASGAADASQADPLQAAWDGEVAWSGTTDAAAPTYEYHVELFGVPTPFRGSGTNDEGDTEHEGTVSAAPGVPRAAGLYYLSGGYSGEGVSCQGSGWLLIRGDPVGTLPWIIGVVLLLLGALGYVAGARGNVVTSVAGGVLFGLGATLLLISHAALPFGDGTPLVVIVTAIALGLLIGFLGRRARRRREQAAIASAPVAGG